MDEIRKLACKELVSEIEDLANLKAGTDEKQKAVASVVELYKVVNEETEAEREREERRKQRKEQFINTIINVGVPAILTVGGWFAYDRWFAKGLKFEETGTITSPWLRNITSKMAPKR